MNTSSTSRSIALMPGFCCNSKIFERLKLPSGHIIKLDWITPEKKESIQSYAARLITPKMRTAEELVLIGHSFGGVIVQEMARIIPVEKIILISSVTSRKGLSNGLHLVRNLRLDIWVHKWTINGTFWMWGKGAGFTRETKPLFKQALKDYKNSYFRWSVKNLARWEQLTQNDIRLVQIHGSKDPIFPIKKVQNPIIIKNGKHLMVYDRADEISKIISDILTKDTSLAP